jgi:hypothetical protein
MTTTENPVDRGTKRDAIRCLKRYVAREIYADIRNIVTTTRIEPPLEQAA